MSPFLESISQREPSPINLYNFIIANNIIFCKPRFFRSSKIINYSGEPSISI